MRPDNILSISSISEDGQIVINGAAENTIKLLGSSVPVSCRIGETVSFLTVSPEKEGIVAVRVNAENYKNTKDKYAHTPEVDFLLNVKKNDEGKLYVDRNNHGSTKQRRLCQIASGIIHITFDEIHSFLPRAMEIRLCTRFGLDIRKFTFLENGKANLKIAIFQKNGSKLNIAIRAEKELKNDDAFFKARLVLLEKRKSKRQDLVNKYSPWPVG